MIQTNGRLLDSCPSKHIVTPRDSVHLEKLFWRASRLQRPNRIFPWWPVTGSSVPCPPATSIFALIVQSSMDDCFGKCAAACGTMGFASLPCPDGMLIFQRWSFEGYGWMVLTSGNHPWGALRGSRCSGSRCSFMSQL